MDAPPTPRAAPPTPAEVPSLWNTLLFVALAVAVTLAVNVAVFMLAGLLPAFHRQDLNTLALDARLTIPAQALGYLALLGAAALVFRSIWHSPFWRTLRWNAPAVAKRWLLLVAAGLALGLVNGAASNILPMPKEAPIMNDLMRSTAGAWLMFLFGTTLAPLVEEVAFRGFLLPSLIHFFRWLSLGSGERRDRRSLEASPFPPPSPQQRPASPLIAVASVLLASLPFALLHAEQVSGAWAPVLLIGIVSVALCVVRLWTNSLAASALVHATYNFTLFAGMMIASDGFRHLEKLNS